MNKKIILAVTAILATACLIFASCSGNVKPDPDNADKENTSSSAEADETSNKTDETSSEADNSSDAAPPLSDAELISEIYGENGSYPYITLEAEEDNVSAGDSVTVDLKLNNAENLACFDITIVFDSSVLTLDDYKETQIENFFFMPFESENFIRYAGYTATTYDFDGDTVISLTFKVNDDASVKTSVLTATATEFMIGTDDAGDVVADLVNVQDVACECVIAIAE